MMLRIQSSAGKLPAGQDRIATRKSLHRVAPLVAAVSLALSSPAWAACQSVANDPGTVICDAGPGVAVIPNNYAGTAGVNTTADTTDLQVTAGNITSGASGLLIDGLNSGKTIVESQGTIRAGSPSLTTVIAALQVRSFSGTGVDVHVAGELSSQGTSASGLNVSNIGSGDTNVVVDSKITADANWGVAVSNDNNTSHDLRLSGTDVTFNEIGAATFGAVTVNNQGSGITDVRFTGDITTKSRIGVDVSAGGSAGDVNVEVHNVTGAIDTGVDITYNGTGKGNVRLAVSGRVEGGQDAIRILNLGQGSTTTLALNTGADIQGNISITGISNTGNILELNGQGTLAKALSGFNRYSATSGSQWALDGETSTDPSDLQFTTAESSDLTVNGAISGSKALVKDGDGTLSLSAANTYQGGTRINAGTVMVGNSGALGTGAVAMGDRTTLSLADQVDLGNAFSISGEANFAVGAQNTATLHGERSDGSSAGTAVKTGAGLLILSGNSSTTGGFRIDQGSLQLNNNGALGSGQLSMADATTLALNDGLAVDNAIALAGKGTVAVAGTSASLTGVIGGTGVLEKTGAGKLILSGANTYTGGTTVSAGTLEVDGTLVGSTTVNNMARLAGTGTLGDVTVNSGGIFAPGHSPGTINVNGNLNFASGSIYEVEILGNGVSDQINATGTATIDNASMQVTALDPKTSYRNGQTYNVLTAAGGITGKFATPTTTSDFLTLNLNYTGTGTTLDIGVIGAGDGDDPSTPNPVVFQTAAVTRNQKNVASALDSLPQSGEALALYNSLLVLDADTARQAFDGLSGEIHAGARTAMLDDRFLQSGIGQHLQDASSREVGTWTPWAGGAGRSIRIDSDGNGAKFNSTNQGLLAGVDWEAGDGFTVGMSAGTEDINVKEVGLGSRADIDSTQGGLYAAKNWQQLWVRGGATYASYDINSHRDAAGQQVRSSYDAEGTTFFAEGGWNFQLPSTVLSPYISVAHTRLHTDGTTEQGGNASLNVAKSKDELLTASAGIRAIWDISAGLNDGARLTANLAWQNASEELKAGSRQQFVAGGDSFTTYGTPLARNSAIAEIGVGVQTSASSRLTVSANGRAGDGMHEFGAGLSWSINL